MIVNKSHSDVRPGYLSVKNFYSVMISSTFYFVQSHQPFTLFDIINLYLDCLPLFVSIFILYITCSVHTRKQYIQLPVLSIHPELVSPTYGSTPIITNHDKYCTLVLSCDVCEAEIITIIRKVLTRFTCTNILFNNYTTAHSDTISDTKIAKKSIYIFLM